MSVETNSRSNVGARSRAAIAPSHLADLNAGVAQARTLSEALAIDQVALFSHVVPDADAAAFAAVTKASSLGILQRMTAIGELLHGRYGGSVGAHFATHPSDTVRGWACFMVGADVDASIPDLLERIRPLADDPHFAVREWAWMGIRHRLAADLTIGIAALTPWTTDASERVRRFSSESLRPRGVWAAHIPALKNEPDLGLPLIEPLRSDPARYVQDSVANWINDVSKSQPDWAVALCDRWMRESPTPQTERVTARALRSIRQKT